MEQVIQEIVRRRNITVAVAIMLLKNKKRKRRWWVHPINQRRLQQGDGDNLLAELRLSDGDLFFNYTRLNITQFDLLLSLVKDKLTKINKYRRPIPPETRIAVTLR